MTAGSNNNLAGRVLIRYRTKAAMDFANYGYVIIVNTCATGDDDTPLPNAFNSTFLNYSYSISVGATSGGISTTVPYLQQYILTSGTANPLNPQMVPLNPSQVTLQLDDNGSNNEFLLTIDRSKLDNPLGVAQTVPEHRPGLGHADCDRYGKRLADDRRRAVARRDADTRPRRHDGADRDSELGRYALLAASVVRQLLRAGPPHGQTRRLARHRRPGRHHVPGAAHRYDDLRSAYDRQATRHRAADRRRGTTRRRRHRQHP